MRSSRRPVLLTWYAPLLLLFVRHNPAAVPAWPAHIKHPDALAVPCQNLGPIRAEGQAVGSSDLISLIIAPVAGSQDPAACIPQPNGLALQAPQHTQHTQHSIHHLTHTTHSTWQAHAAHSTVGQTKHTLK